MDYGKRMLFFVAYKDTDNVVREIVVSEENVMVFENKLYIRDIESNKREWKEIDISFEEKDKETGTEKNGWDYRIHPNYRSV